MDVIFLVNCFFVVFNGWLCWYCFRADNRMGGWVNLFASSFNLAIILDRIIV